MPDIPADWLTFTSILGFYSIRHLSDWYVHSSTDLRGPTYGSPVPTVKLYEQAFIRYRDKMDDRTIALTAGRIPQGRGDREVFVPGPVGPIFHGYQTIAYPTGTTTCLSMNFNTKAVWFAIDYPAPGALDEEDRNIVDLMLESFEVLPAALADVVPPTRDEQMYLEYLESTWPLRKDRSGFRYRG